MKKFSISFNLLAWISNIMMQLAKRATVMYKSEGFIILSKEPFRNEIH